MHLTLLISDLLPPQAFIPEPDLPRLPGLEALLRGASVTRREGAFLEEALLDEFELPVSTPIAPLTLLADGGMPGDQAWLRADPVHLRVSRDNVQLMDSHVVEPTEAEAAAIALTLNKHLTADGLTIDPRDASRWYMNIPPSEMPVATPLWRMAGGSVFDSLPIGRGARNWRGMQNELQMLLFDHPVNAEREVRGEPAINGIWFWGAGVLPVVNSRRYDGVIAKLALARGLAACAKISLRPLPESLEASFGGSRQTLVVLHQLTRALRGNNRAAWLDAAREIDSAWLVPARAALAGGKLKSVRLVLSNESRTVDATARGRLSWSFWRREKPLSAYA